MTSMYENFASFEAAAKRGGYTEVIAKDWEPSLVLERHTHPYDVDALLVSGNMALEIDGETRHLVAGDAFQLAANVLHSEVYGPNGATLWVARRHLTA
jgi:quercetin dioxygenase-like cupin family protein